MNESEIKQWRVKLTSGAQPGVGVMNYCRLMGHLGNSREYQSRGSVKTDAREGSMNQNSGNSDVNRAIWDLEKQELLLGALGVFVI